MSIDKDEIYEDLDWVAAFKKGENPELPFTKIVKKYQEKLYWHIRRLVVEHENANDVMQNTFIKVWKNLSGFREDSKLYTWLYRIATNESLTFLANQKKRASLSIDHEVLDLSNKIKAESNFDGQKLEWKLQLAIQKLPEKQRAVFNLRYYDEMPYAEISAIMETSEGALKANYHHAVKKIEQYILNHID